MAKEGKLEKKFLVVGPGAIGCAVAASLANAGVRTQVLGKERHKVHFTKNPIIYKTKSENIKSKIDAITIEDLREEEFIPDVVLVTLKANHTIQFMKELEKIIPTSTIIVSLQNGLIAQEIYNKTSFNNVYACVIGFNVFTEKLGEATQASEGDLTLGKVVDTKRGEKSDDVPDFIIEALSNVAPTNVSDNIIGDVWMKVMINSTINPICAIGNIKLGELPQSLDSLTLALWTWGELVYVVDAINIKLNPFQGKLYPEILYAYDIISYGIARNVVERIVSEHKDAIVSMLQDIRSNRETEIDFLNGKIYSIGQEHNVSMPVNELLIKTIKQLEKGEIKPSKALINKLYKQMVLK
ncbi:MAG: ketopantoate reductase family protein [Candidatus Heimdallarchaeaceae archaeon]